MKLKRQSVLIAALALLVGLGLAQFNRMDAQVTASAPSRVGVCNIQKVFMDYKRSKDLGKQMQKEASLIEAENDRRLEKIKQLNNDLKAFTVDSKQYNDALMEYQQAVLEQKVWVQMKQETMGRKHARLTREMYDDIKKVVAAVAKQRGVGVVLQINDRPLTGNMGTELLAQISQKNVVYSAAELDITGAVIQKLNEAYIVHN